MTHVKTIILSVIALAVLSAGAVHVHAAKTTHHVASRTEAQEHGGVEITVGPQAAKRGVIACKNCKRSFDKEDHNGFCPYCGTDNN